MNRRIRLIVFFIFFTLLFPLNESKYIETKSDYVVWEEICLEEYNQSQDTYIFVDLTKCKLTFFKENKPIKSYNIAIGTSENPSPIGLFRVIEKGKWGKSFGGRWMGLNVPWGIYGIHGTTRPWSIGKAASHGCIRMRNEDIEELYDQVPHGTVVEIYGGPFGPFGKGFRVLRPGDTGSDVVEVQRRLKMKGYYKGRLNGSYSKAMENALNRFQKDKGLSISNVINSGMYERLGIILDE